jgi:hypothetical protein
MTLFETVKIALDALYTQCKKRYADKTDRKIKDAISYLSKAYGQLNADGRNPINYEDPATRFAYVYKYTATHGDYLVQILEQYRNKHETNVFRSESVKVSCVGGGPGSDIVAVLKYLDEFKADEPVRKLTFFLLDKEQAWGDTWSEFDESFTGDLRMNTSFQPLDVTKPASYRNQTKFFEADLFTLSYFISEVLAFDGDGSVTGFLTTLFQNAKSGALFLYDDNGHSSFSEFFDAQWKRAGLKCLHAADRVSWTPRHSEQASELGDYLGKFGQAPKLKSELSYRLLGKK